MDETARIVDYNNQWPKLFERECALLARTLENAALKIHHVGSTSVPGMPAKPIIDIAIESTEYPPSQSMIDLLKTIGYTHRGEEGVPGRHWFCKGKPRSHHIHWVPVDGRVLQQQLKFKELLKANPSVAKKYAELKLSAPTDQSIDSHEYNLMKAPFIAEVLEEC